MVLGLIGNVLGGSLLNFGGPKTPFDFAQRRRIQDRSFIKFVFPTPYPLIAKLPFYENIDIKESKDANIVTYNPIGRNSSLYTYTGASSRKLKLTFALTLQHIQSMHDRHKIRFEPGSNPGDTREQIKKLFKQGNKPLDSEPPSLPPTYGGTPGEAAVAKNKADHEKKLAEEQSVTSSSEPLNWVKYIAWWVNLIRSSVMSNQVDTTQGPPIIRLTHGELYQNIPCICHSYDVSYDGDAGMDVHSLLSRRILVSMNLEEFRAGNFGEFDRTSKQILDRDNVTGWESIITHSTTDPGAERQKISFGELDRRYKDKK